jgi:hypothetical protein
MNPNPNPTDSNRRPMVEGAHYYLDQANPHTQYLGLFGQNLRFKIVDGGPERFVFRSHYFHPTLLLRESPIGGRRKSKSKRRKTNRRKSRKNKSRRR